MSNTYNCIYIYAKKLNNKTGCVKVNISFVYNYSLVQILSIKTDNSLPKI